jgi:hypothetical protein
MGQHAQPEKINAISHAVNSIHIASATLKRAGAIGTLEDALMENMPSAPSDEPNIKSITAYAQGERDYLKGVDYNAPLPKHCTNAKDHKAGWLNMARTQCAMYHDLKTILEKAPELERILTKAGKNRLANLFKKLTTTTPSEEGRSVMQHTA